MSKESMGYVSEKELEKLVSEENLAGGTTWGCAALAATIALATATITNTGTTNACTKSCRKFR